MLTNWLRTDLMTQVNSLMSNLTVGIFNVISEVFNMLIGVIVSVYILYIKKNICTDSVSKAVLCIVPADRCYQYGSSYYNNEVFGGCDRQDLNSAIIGLLCFID